MLTSVPSLPLVEEALAEDEFAVLGEFLLPGEELAQILIEQAAAI